MARLLEKYTSEIAPALRKELSIGNVMDVPKLTKIVINIGMGDAVSNSKLLDSAVEELGAISGQKPIVTRARKAVAAFRLREGMPIGCKVTLRGTRMYEFLDRLVSVALPRIRDFRGVSEKGFDGRGNFTLGLKEQLVFPEIDYEKAASVHGMDISFVNTAQDNEQGIALMRHLGMPFRKV